MTDKIYYNAFNQIPQIGAVRFKKLAGYFPSMEDAWRAPLSELLNAGLEQQVGEIIVTKRITINPEAEWEKVGRANVTIITQADKSYPATLREIHNSPALLYLRGKIEALSSDHAVAVVGTRKISTYGKQVTGKLASDLATAGVVIVSGLALGVDEQAHRAAVDANAATVAVLGSGIDDNSIYPPSNRLLARKIMEGRGALISELPLGAQPLKLHFPYRNRIIAGLSRGVIVVEADLKSGSLITAKQALEENRQVFAVPGSIYNQMSAGPNNLLKMGAQAVTEAADVLSALNLEHAEPEKSARKIIAETPAEAKLLNLLSNEPLHIDKIIKESGLTSAEASSALTLMEIKGKVRNLGAMQYVRAR